MQISVNKFVGDFCRKEVREALCEMWHSLSAPPPPESQMPCPPQASQARADLRFAPETSRQTAFYHEGSKVCYQSLAASEDGSGQNCCYKNEKIDCGINGGRAQVSHPNSPFKHYVHDVLPWIMCVYDQPNHVRQFYRGRRPCDRGNGYIPPAPARGTGDPHINTFDGSLYTFNGYGEFWLLQNTTTQPLAVQARMEPLNTDENDATIFSGFVFAVGDSPTIQIQKSLVRVVDVYVDGQQLDITSPTALRAISMNGWHMSIEDDLSTIHIGFSHGFAFEVTTTSGAFGFSASASPSWKGKTVGLLGTFNDDSNDDLTSSDGTVIPSNSSLSDIHYQFGLTWTTTSATSIFTYFNGKTFADFNIPDYTPSFSFDPDTVSEDGQQLCSGDWTCLYDYHFSGGNAEIAQQTLMSNHDYQEIVTDLQNWSSMCPPLNTPANGYLIAPNYFAGANASFGCLDNYSLNSNTSYFCDPGTLEWLPEDYTSVQCIEDGATSSAAASYPTSILFLLLGFFAAFFL